MRKSKHNNNTIKKRQDNANRFTVILFMSVLVNLSFYLLPEKFLGLDIKKVDLFSDIRIGNDGINDLLMSGSDVEDIPFLTGIERKNDVNTVVNPCNKTTKAVMSPSGNNAKEKDADKSENNSEKNETDDSELIISSEDFNFDKNDIYNKYIEDFSRNHNSLHHFFSALNNINRIGRPVRIAFAGDSFIEGDIVVADFRARMQERFGGRGVGFIPVSSNVAQFRPTVKQSAKGWKTHSIINNKKQKYVLSGLLFEPKSADASISFSNVDVYPGLKEVSSLKIIYANSESAEVEFFVNDEENVIVYDLPSSSDEIRQFEIKGKFPAADIKFKNAAGLQVFGIALEDNTGIVVDNFSLRGNSGIVMSAIDSERCRELQQIRPYDLIVLQYGLNVASDSVREYGWYHKGMITVIQHIKNCYPGADIMLLGVSDRSHKRGGTYTTMPAVLSLLRAQRQTARDTEIAFWNIFAAMGGQNSMVQYVKTNKASKDYTHLSFKGGREIADALYDAIIQEKRMYDRDE